MTDHNSFRHEADPLPDLQLCCYRCLGYGTVWVHRESETAIVSCFEVCDYCNKTGIAPIPICELIK